MKRVERVRCPLCAHSKPIVAPKRTEKGELIWVPFTVDTEFIQIREGGGKVGTGEHGRGHGKGYGFPLVASLTIKEVLEIYTNDYQVIVHDLRLALVNLVKEAVKMGLLSEGDLK
jgi:hypothetical protein